MYILQTSQDLCRLHIYSTWCFLKTIFIHFITFTKRLPLPFTYNNEKKVYTFFPFFFGTVQTLYNKNISLYKRFFVFVFVLLFFFFPHGMAVGMWCGWQVKGLACLAPSTPLAAERKCQHPTSMWSLGISWDFTGDVGEGRGRVEEESTG